MRFWKLLAVASFSAFTVAGCGSNATPTSQTAPQDRGVETTDPPPGTTPGEGQGSEVNPYGKPYPAENLGYQARAGKRPGNIIRNYKFLGYRDGDPSKGRTVISLADLFDPETRQYKLIHFSAGALWCPPCNEEAKAIVPLVPSLKQKKVVVIQAIIEGNVRGTASTLDDLDTWQKKHSINYTLFLDPSQQNLGQFFDAAAIPWNGMIDARSMELLSSGVGYNPDMPKEYDSWLKWIDSNPPQAAP